MTYELPALTAALCRPRAGARNAAPRAPTNRTGKAAGAGRARVAMAHGDGDSTVRRDLAANADQEIASVNQDTVGDPDRITVARYAIALFGDDRHAPYAVIARRGKTWCSGKNRRYGQ